MGQALSRCVSPEAADEGHTTKKQHQAPDKHKAAAAAAAGAVDAPPGGSRTTSSSSSSSSSASSSDGQHQQQEGVSRSKTVDNNTPLAATVTAAGTAKGKAAAVAAAAAAGVEAASATPKQGPSAAAAASQPSAAAAAAAASCGPNTAVNHNIPLQKLQQGSQPQQGGSTVPAAAAAAAAGPEPLCPCLPLQPSQATAAGTAAAAAAAEGGGVHPCGCAPGPGLPHNPFLSGPPLPPCDEERAKDEALVADLLGREPRKELDNILQLVCNIFGVRNALIALFGERCIWVLRSTTTEIQEGDFEWRHSFCAWTMASEQHQVLVVNDTLQDARFADNPMVLQGGIRFYAGSPLVNSRGHRLGTLCFADSKPRVFDTSSLQVLVNLSELIARELERGIVLAKQQYSLQQQQRQQYDSAARFPLVEGPGGVLGRQRLVESYQLLLRSIDCVTSAVLLVDTANPVWPILHSSSGWQQLLQQLGGSNGGCAAGSNGGCDDSSSSSSSSIGQSLWSLLDATSMRSRGSGGVTAQQQVLSQVQHSQSFTLRGVQLAADLGGVGVQLVFRCAGFSTVQGAVGICLPSFAPDCSEVSAAAAALSRSNPTGTHVTPSTTPCDSLYFVTVKPSHRHTSVSSGVVSVTSSDRAAAAAAAAAGMQGSGVGAGPAVVQPQQLPPGFSVRAVDSSSSSSSRPGENNSGSKESLYYQPGMFGGSNGQPPAGSGSIAGGCGQPPAGFGSIAGSNGQPPAGFGSIAGGCGSSGGGCFGSSGSGALPVVDVVDHPQFSAADGAPDRGDNGFVTDADVFLSDLVVGSAAAAAVPPPRSSPVSSFSSGPLLGVGRYPAAGSVAGSTPSSSMFSNFSTAGSKVTSDSSLAHTAASRDTAVAAAIAAISSSSSTAAGSSAASPVVPKAGKSTDQGRGWRLIVERSSGSNGSSGGGFVAGGGPAASILAGLVCENVAGLHLGGQIAAGSYGRVYKGTYFGSKVAVKVLDGADVLRRDAATGVSLEALLASGLKHPSVVATHAWAVVTGKGQLPARVQVWGHTLDSSKPNAPLNSSAPVPQQQQQQQQQQQRRRHKQDLNPSSAEPLYTKGNTSSSSSSSSSAAFEAGTLAAAGGVLGTGDDSSGDSSDEEHDSSSSSGGADLAQLIGAGQTWLIMEFCDKGCLQDAVDRGWLRHRRSYRDGPLNLAAVLATACEIASGLAALHGQGVVHGDLSAFNIMLSSSDAGASSGGRGFVAKVADFGLSRTLGSTTSKVVTKTYGTITHMPPEMLEHGICSKAADVYSFGVLLWQMVTSSRAWAGMSHSAVVQAVCVKKQTLQFPADSPGPLSMLGQACLAHDPADRPTFSDILEVLEPCQALLTQ